MYIYVYIYVYMYIYMYIYAATGRTDHRGIPCLPCHTTIVRSGLQSWSEKLILQSRATTPPSARRDSHDAAVSTHPHDYWLPMYSVVFLFLFLFFPCYTVQVLSFFFFSSFLFLRSIMWWSSLDNFFIKIILKKYTENRTQKFYDEFCV